MTAFREFYKLVQPLIDEITQPTAERLANRVSQKFFKEARSWRFQDELTTAASTLEYTWPMAGLDADIVVTKVISASRGTTPLGVASVYQLNRRMPDWRTAASAPVFMIPGIGRKFTLAPLPVGGETIYGDLALAPSHDSTALPDDIFSEFEDVLLDGILAEAYSQMNRAWADPAMAAFHGARFNVGIVTASRKAHTNDHYKGGTGYGGI